MNKILVVTFILLVFIAQQNIAASVDLSRGNFWRCLSHDATNRQWVADDSYEIVATNKSFGACKKESPYPGTCKTSKEACELFVNGLTTRPMWMCTAFDQRATTYNSIIYSNQDDAALAAKAYCRQKSPIPDTCYIHTITCKNLNLRD